MSLNIKLKRSAVAGSAPTAAQLEDGELAVNYNDTDPALYIKDSTGAVVRIAGEGAAGSDLQAVTDTGNTTTNNVLIGGTLPTSPNISLGAAGIIAAAGDVSSGDLTQTSTTTSGATLGSRGDILVQRPSAQPNNNLFVGFLGNAQTFQITADGTTSLGGTLPSSPSIKLNASGSATFAGEVQINGTSGSSNRLKITQTGSNSSDQSSIRLTTPASDYALYSTGDVNRLTIYDGNANSNRLQLDAGGNVGIGGTLPSSPNIELNADGSATFAGNVTASATGDSDNQVFLDSRGAILAFRETTASTWSSLSSSSSVVPSTGYQILSGGNYNAGTRVATSWINSNGSAYFQDQVGIGGTLPASPNISLDANGSATFAGLLKVDRDAITFAIFERAGATRCAIGDEGVYVGTDVSPGANPVTGNNISLKTDGSAAFAGTIQIGGTLPSSPNIELNADGSSTFALDATINGLTVGLGGGSLSTNTAIGVNTLLANTTGNSNVAIGRTALRNNIGGGSNTAVGWSALLNNTTGLSNTSLGREALQGNIDGAANTAIGLRANYSNTTGGYNTTVGMDAGYFIEGSNNTVLGAYRGTTADATLSDTVIISAGTTERARCDSNGTWQFPGSVSIGGTAAANTIDEYEEGTWTPNVLQFGSNNPVSFTVINANYVRIGSQVTMQCTLQLDASSNGVTYQLLVYGHTIFGNPKNRSMGLITTNSSVEAGIGYSSGTNFTFRGPAGTITCGAVDDETLTFSTTFII